MNKLIHGLFIAMLQSKLQGALLEECFWTITAHSELQLTTGVDPGPFLASFTNSWRLIDV